MFQENRQGESVACYVRNDLNDNTLSVFPREVKNIFFEILLSNSKPTTVGTIYCKLTKIFIMRQDINYRK